MAGIGGTEDTLGPVFGAVMNLDRVLIAWRIPDGERALGLYSIALMGTSWSLDLAGRIVTVLYTYFQTTLGRTRDRSPAQRETTLAAGASTCRVSSTFGAAASSE